MMKPRLFIIALVCIFIAIPLYGQNEAFFLGTVSGVGGRALSMGSAYVAIADDYSATMWNPAGLTQLRRMELFASISHLQFENEAFSEGNSMTDKTTKTKLNSIGFAFPIPTYRGSMVFAVGYNKVRSFDGGFSFGGFNELESVRAHQMYNEVEEGDMANWVFSGAIQVTPNLSVGGALNLWRGENNYNWSLMEEDRLDEWYYHTFDYTQQITTNFSATNVKLGALYQLGFLGRVAATVSTPIKINAKEKWSEYSKQIEDDDSPYDDYEDSETGKWDYGIKSSWQFSAGAALTLLPNIVISADLEYNDWSQMRYTSEPPVSNQYRKNLDFKQNFQPTATIRLGGEFTVPLINTQLRAGAIRQPSPLKDASEKADRNFLTLGCGILLDKQVKLDVAYVRGWWEREGTYLSEYFDNISETIKVDKIYATMSIRF